MVPRSETNMSTLGSFPKGTSFPFWNKRRNCAFPTSRVNGGWTATETERLAIPSQIQHSSPLGARGSLLE
jgi:hypothetical protein